MSKFFPFSSIRDGQKEFVQDVKEILNSKRHLIAHAPTGIGKTAAALAPCVEYALEHNKRVLFLTPRHSQHVIALETLKRIKKKSGAAFSGFDLIGKKWLCNVDSVESMGSRDFLEYCRSVRKDDRCPFYNETFSKEDKRLKKKASDFIFGMSGGIKSAEEIKLSAHEFCPYEILMQGLKTAKVIVADYFHLFHPKVRSSMLIRAGFSLEDAIVIIDEGHNLPERIRSLASFQLNDFALKRAEQECNLFGFHDTEEKVHILRQKFDSLFKRKLSKDNPDSFIERREFMEIVHDIEDFDDLLLELEMVADEVRDKKKRSFCGAVSEFMTNWRVEHDGFSRIIRRDEYGGNKTNRMILRCLNPAHYSGEVFEESHSSIVMSGTLTPLEMYRDVLGLHDGRCLLKSYSSGFSSSNRLNVIVNTVTTQYKKRSEDQFQKLAWYISQSAEAIPGNVGVFFPSYWLRDKILEYLKMEKEILLEVPGSKDARMKLLAEFSSLKDKGAALFGVFRGSFDQGIDFPGDLMNGVVLVGLPLERPDLETQALINYYDLLFDKGWDYGYTFPAMNLAIQASGRCIRSEDDRGVVVFLDERYTWGGYRKAFSPEMKVTISKAPWLEIQRFWGNRKKLQ